MKERKRGSMTRCFVILAVVAVAACGKKADPKVIAANEAAVISDLRAVMSAEETYRASNGNAYDELRCLATPDSCIPGFPKEAPYFLEASLASLAPAHGYVRKFHAGPKAAAEELQRSPTSLTAWAYTAVPEQLGLTGQRAFCVDATGLICASDEGVEPLPADGKCPSSCGPLR
jgi:hypothetical protein